MRVALLTWFYPPGGSGLGRAAHMIAHGLQEAGCAVTVISASLPVDVRQADAGIDIVGCAPRDKGASSFTRRRACIGHLVTPWYFRKTLTRLHRQDPYDIVEATNWYAPAVFLSIDTVPVVVRNSTPAIDAWSSATGFRNRVDLKFAHNLEKRTAQRASGLISNTPTHHQTIEGLYAVNKSSLHNVVELALDPALLERSNLANREFPSASKLLFIGRDERRKGFRETLEAFARLVVVRHENGRPAANLILVGIDDDTVNEALANCPSRHLVRGHITCFPSVTDEVLHDLYDETSIVVAPSRYESYGLVYREAAAFGRPLVACAEDPAAVQFVSDTGCGVLAARCSGHAIQTAIETLIDNQALCDQLGENGRRHAQTLTRHKLGVETLKIYQSVIRSRSAVSSGRRLRNAVR